MGSVTAGWGCIDCKKVLFESMEVELKPIRERAAEVRSDTKKVDEILADGAARAQVIATETIRETKQLMGLT